MMPGIHVQHRSDSAFTFDRNRRSRWAGIRNLLRRGASMADIGDVLRHQRPQTTEIYAKVDLTRLRWLAQSWPSGGGQ